MKLLCQQCGIRGSADLAFVWYAKEIKAKPGDKLPGKVMCLCPDCQQDFETDKERDAFLRTKLKK